MNIKEAISSRHSVRQYLNKPISQEHRDRLAELINSCCDESGLRIQIIYDEPMCFNTFLAHYGKFTNVTNYIALVGKKSLENLDELCGYYGQKIVLAAQQMGLNTCWVAGTATVPTRAPSTAQSPLRSSATFPAMICPSGSGRDSLQP